MDNGLYKDIQDLIRRECCNCISGECVPRSVPCDILAPVEMVGELPKYKMCSWFKNAVLPLDDKLQYRVLAKTHDDASDFKECTLCGKMFYSTDGRQTTCKECRTMDSRRKNSVKRMKKNVKR